MTIQSNNLPIDYLEKGTGDTTLLFVHGSLIDKAYWNSQVDYFSPNYRVVAIDLAGHGKSGKNRTNWTVEAFGEDVVEVVQQLNLQNVILIGHSMGADIILEAAVAHPDPIIGFIGIDNFKMAGTELPEEMQAQVPTILQNMRTDFSNTSEDYARQGLLTEATDATTTSRVVHDFRNAYPEMGVRSAESIFSYWKRERDLLQQLPFKLYLIQCDYYPTDEEPLKLYPKSGYEIFPIHATSHYPMIEKPAEFNQLLEKVINKIVKEIAK